MNDDWIKIDTNSIMARLDEENIIAKTMKENFFQQISGYYTLKEMQNLFDGKSKVNSSVQNKFNTTLKQIKADTNIPIYEMVICLEKSFTKFKKILSILDDELIEVVKNELATEYNIPIETSTLESIIEK